MQGGGGSGGCYLSEDVGGSDDDEAERLPSEYECSGMRWGVELKGVDGRQRHK